jgi:hypothetical protein
MQSCRCAEHGLAILRTGEQLQFVRCSLSAAIASCLRHEANADALFRRSQIGPLDDGQDAINFGAWGKGIWRIAMPLAELGGRHGSRHSAGTEISAASSVAIPS